MSLHIDRSHYSHSSLLTPHSSVLPWRWWPADVVLGFMLSGLLVGPLFTQLGGPLFGPIGRFVYALGAWICPEPAQNFIQVAGYAEVVCLRCMAALGGLLIVRMLFARPVSLNRWWHRLTWPQRALVAAPVLAVWQLDIYAIWNGWWASPAWVQTLGGVFLGLAIGFLVYPLLVWLSHQRLMRRR